MLWILFTLNQYYVFIYRHSVSSEQPNSLSSAESFPHSSTSITSCPVQEENFTTPSNFKTHAMFYGENDPVPDLEQNVADLINSLFWVVESKRLERSREKLEKVSLILAPFEKKDFVGTYLLCFFSHSCMILFFL